MQSRAHIEVLITILIIFASNNYKNTVLFSFEDWTDWITGSENILKISTIVMKRVFKMGCCIGANGHSLVA